MKEHILNFAIAIEDDAIINAVQSKAEKQIIEEIKLEVLSKIFESNKYYGEKVVSIDRYSGKTVVDKNAILNEFAKCIIKESMESFKDEIVELAANRLVESARRSKKWKESIENVCEVEE